jgi:hypothetical protein
MKSIAAAMVLAGLLFVDVRAACAQSLADIAKKEEERRKNTTTPAKVITNEDLGLTRSEERFKNAPASQKPQIAATMFMGTYLRATRAYSTFCKQNWGIDIDHFVSAWVGANRAEYVRATQILAASGLPEEKLWAGNEAAIRQDVEHEMNGVPGNRGSMEACRGLEMGAEAIASDLHFSKLFPQVHAALMAPPR